MDTYVFCARNATYLLRQLWWFWIHLPYLPLLPLRFWLVNDVDPTMITPQFSHLPFSKEFEASYKITRYTTILIWQWRVAVFAACRYIASPCHLWMFNKCVLFCINNFIKKNIHMLCKKKEVMLLYQFQLCFFMNEMLDLQTYAYYEWYVRSPNIAVSYPVKPFTLSINSKAMPYLHPYHFLQKNRLRFQTPHK